MSVPSHALGRPSLFPFEPGCAWLVFPAVCCLLFACQSPDPWFVEVSDTQALDHWESHRADVFTGAGAGDRPDWGGFEQDYVESILALGPAKEDSTWMALARFASHSEIQHIAGAIDSLVAPHVLKSETELHAAFRRFHFFFPGEPTPDLVWMNSGFVNAVYPTPDHLALGMEWFLGAEHPLYRTLPPHLFPDYIQRRMAPEFMVADALRGWLLVQFAETHFNPEQCADAVLYYGKIMFILSRLLPEVDDRILMDWSAEDLAWAEANEPGIWLELMPREVLYEKDKMKFNRWFQEAPFTRVGDIPQESPDRLGIWMGWNIVEDFMAQHPELAFEELMTEEDPLILLKSYRP